MKHIPSELSHWLSATRLLANQRPEFTNAITYIILVFQAGYSKGTIYVTSPAQGAGILTYYCMHMQ